MTKYISCADTAKLIRKALKESFSNVKFAVRSHVYSGGASINVSWTDGPNEAQVSAVAGHFRAAYFDGSIDYQGSIYHMIDGEAVHLGADFIFFKRDYSTSAIQRAIDSLYRHYEGNFKGSTEPRATVEDFQKGRLHTQQVPGLNDNGLGYWGMQAQIARTLAKHSDRLKVQTSTTAAKIFETHDDNYSKTNGSGFSVLNVDA